MATPRIGTIIAERRLVVRDGGGEVRVAIGVPRRDRNGVDWACPFRIHGAGISRVEYGYGVDAMQALTTALEGIRVVLDDTGLALGWNLGAGTVLDGETGFARSVPIALGGGFSRRMERLLDRELRMEIRRFKQRHPPRRRTAAKGR